MINWIKIFVEENSNFLSTISKVYYKIIKHTLEIVNFFNETDWFCLFKIFSKKQNSYQLLYISIMFVHNRDKYSSVVEFIYSSISYVEASNDKGLLKSSYEPVVKNH